MVSADYRPILVLVKCFEPDKVFIYLKGYESTYKIINYMPDIIVGSFEFDWSRSQHTVARTGLYTAVCGAAQHYSLKIFSTVLAKYAPVLGQDLINELQDQCCRQQYVIM
jgi:hypothetical protein